MLNYTNMGAKLIRSPLECGHRVKGKCFWFIFNCTNSETDETCLIKNCTPRDEDNFPLLCPLEDGFIKPKNT
jgi:hypothetical protein